MIGSMLARVEWVMRIVRVISTKRDSMRPSRHRSDDIRWDRYISNPRRDVIKAMVIFK